MAGQFRMRSCLLISRYLNKQSYSKVVEPSSSLSSIPTSTNNNSATNAALFYPSSQSIHEKLNDFYNDPNKTKSQKIIFIRQWVETLLCQGRVELVGSIVNRFDHKIPKPVTPLNFIFKSESDYWKLLNELLKVCATLLKPGIYGSYQCGIVLSTSRPAGSAQCREAGTQPHGPWAMGPWGRPVPSPRIRASA